MIYVPIWLVGVFILFMIPILIIVYGNLTKVNLTVMLKGMSEELPDRYWLSDMTYINKCVEEWEARVKAGVVEPELELTVPLIVYFNEKFTVALDDYGKNNDLIIQFEPVNILLDNIKLTISH